MSLSECEMSEHSKILILLFRYSYTKLTGSRLLFFSTDLNSGINLNPIPNWHLRLLHLREELKIKYDDHSSLKASIFQFVNFLPSATDKQSSWTDGATVP